MADTQESKPVLIFRFQASRPPLVPLLKEPIRERLAKQKQTQRSSTTEQSMEEWVFSQMTETFLAQQLLGWGWTHSLSTAQCL